MKGERPALTLDVSLYEKYLEDTNLTDEQKKEFLETLWSLVVSFVDLGFDIHPIQQACGEKANGGEFPAQDIADLIKSENQLPKKSFSNAVLDKEDHRAERKES